MVYKCPHLGEKTTDMQGNDCCPFQFYLWQQGRRKGSDREGGILVSTEVLGNVFKGDYNSLLNYIRVFCKMC